MFGSLPAILRVTLVFLIVLFAIRKNASLEIVLFCGSILLGFLFDLTPFQMIHSVFRSVTHPKTISLTIMVCLILVFSHSMELAGQMQRLLDRYRGLIASPRINLVVFPALIGLLPMPGGAIFSAPMVKSLGKNLNLSNAQLSFTNYWFRHIWEYWWPLYPGVLLTTALADLNIWTFVVFLFPLTSIAFFSGYLPLSSIGRIREGTISSHSERDRLNSIRLFARELFPIFIVIGLGLTLGALLTYILQDKHISVTKELGLILALTLAIAWVWQTNKLTWQQRWQVLTQPQLVRMFAMVLAILVFKGMLEDSQAVKLIGQELIHWHIPLMPISVVLPFIVGGIVGITIAFVGTTFPILISLIQALGRTDLMLPYMMLALASGFVGVLLSPLHLCLLLSNEYFSISLTPVYRYLWVPSVILLVSACVYFFILCGYMAS